MLFSELWLLTADDIIREILDAHNIVPRPRILLRNYSTYSKDRNDFTLLHRLTHNENLFI